MNEGDNVSDLKTMLLRTEVKEGRFLRVGDYQYTNNNKAWEREK
jgi:hypothetical protein